MARTVKEEDYAARRKEILNIARQLVYTKGYEQMSIQDILNALTISKGAFYHYFDSKPDLLEALIDQIADEAEAAIAPALDSPTLSALEKLNHYFRNAVAWKSAQKDFMLALLRTWYSDDNALVRQKVFTKTLTRISPVFERVIRQGMAEGTLSTPSPVFASEIMLHMTQALGDKFRKVLLQYGNGDSQPNPEERFRIMSEALAAYSNALERLLGVAPGSIEVMDSDSIRMWIE